MAIPHDPFTCFIGDAWQIEVTCGDDNGDPLDITTATEIEWLLNDTAGQPNLLRLTLGNGIEILDGPSGRCLVRAEPEQTEDIVPGYYRDQVRLTIEDEPGVQTYGIITVKDRLRPNP